jgi:hypothetical protein
MSKIILSIMIIQLSATLLTGEANAVCYDDPVLKAIVCDAGKGRETVCPYDEHKPCYVRDKHGR